MKKYLPIVILAISIILPVILAVFIASERARIGLERLEQDLVIVQDTQFHLFNQLVTKSSSPSAKEVK